MTEANTVISNEWKDPNVKKYWEKKWAKAMIKYVWALARYNEKELSESKEVC